MHMFLHMSKTTCISCKAILTFHSEHIWLTSGLVLFVQLLSLSDADCPFCNFLRLCMCLFFVFRFVYWLCQFFFDLFRSPLHIPPLLCVNNTECISFDYFISFVTYASSNRDGIAFRYFKFFVAYVYGKSYLIPFLNC